MVTVQYSSETKPILTIADAIKADSLYPYPGEGNVLMVGDANGVLIMCYICQPINYVCISVLSLGIVLSLQQDVRGGSRLLKRGGGTTRPVIIVDVRLVRYLHS